MAKDMSIEDLQLLLKRNKEQQQENRMSDILDRVENLLDQACQKGYEPTSQEKEMFRRVLDIVNNMSAWF